MTYRSIFRPDLFAGQTFLITGGGSGIGQATAAELAGLGAHVALAGRTAEKLQAAAAEITAAGGAVSTYPLDIRDEAAVTRVVGEIVADRGRIDGLVNNAGGQFLSPLLDMSKKGFEAVVRNNLVGGFLVAREVVRQSMRETGGAIVNMTADFWQGMVQMGHSGAARAGMANLTRTAAVEWAPFGVRVNAVAPGIIHSSGLDTYPPEVQMFLRGVSRFIPAKRLGTEAEVSAAICFLLSEAAAFITGVTLPIDGGQPLETPMWPTPDHDRSRPFGPRGEDGGSED